ncbi:toxin-antitoxin system, antitoxin component, Xre family [Trichinella spiralis]|uniref:toxin-antitoxin system, antitoxin component, Xre family n=1 Tax=Trichinella spiralis TaxID=6334 RepID=UPI0001EFB297|nr:toxin-antitoxin system, antitoxin component, Xre family [Trichinella spiralis]
MPIFLANKRVKVAFLLKSGTRLCHCVEICKMQVARRICFRFDDHSWHRDSYQGNDKMHNELYNYLVGRMLKQKSKCQNYTTEKNGILTKIGILYVNQHLTKVHVMVITT